METCFDWEHAVLTTAWNMRYYQGGGKLPFAYTYTKVHIYM